MLRIILSRWDILAFSEKDNKQRKNPSKIAKEDMKKDR